LKTEIKELIEFYEKRGWEWVTPVAYLAATHAGVWPPKDVRPYKHKSNKKDEKK
jgi:hypothetical protein